MKQRRSVRGLRPLESEDHALLEVVMCGEFAILEFGNRDLRARLFGESSDEPTKKRQSAQITRRLRLLRAHKLIKKVGGTHRYHLTKQGRTTITALLAASNCGTKQLTEMAA